MHMDTPPNRRRVRVSIGEKFISTYILIHPSLDESALYLARSHGAHFMALLYKIRQCLSILDNYYFVTLSTKLVLQQQ